MIDQFWMYFSHEVYTHPGRNFPTRFYASRMTPSPREGYQASFMVTVMSYELRFSKAEATAILPCKFQEAYDQSFENRQRLESEYHNSAGHSDWADR